MKILQKNFTCRLQDAPQGCHWNNMQCAIHPAVAMYHCPVEDCTALVTDPILYVSDDFTRDRHDVHQFVPCPVLLLQQEGVQFDHFIQFWDGAQTRYKKRISFVDCSDTEQELGVKAEQHFYGSRHGKSPRDREIGVLKKNINRLVAVRKGEVMSAQQLFEEARHQLSMPRVDGHFLARDSSLLVS